MTTKTPGKNPQGPPEARASQHELQAALQVHTLAQMLYGQMVAAYPWMHAQQPMQMSPMTMPMSPMMTPTSTMAPPQEAQAFNPTMGPAAPPWMPYCSTCVCNPMMGRMNPPGFPWIGTGFIGSDFPR